MQIDQVSRSEKCLAIKSKVYDPVAQLARPEYAVDYEHILDRIFNADQALASFPESITTVGRLEL